MIDKILAILPIKKDDWKKFLPMAFMMVCVLFNYNELRGLKDALVVPEIGAEAISFIKLYCVVPAAVIAMLVYSKMTNVTSSERIFVYFTSFFMVWFLFFAFILYPNVDAVHPAPESIEGLITAKYDLVLFSIDMSHFKWFVLIYSKWSYALFYVLAELWGSVMLSLLFWQFANHITRTSEAKTFYPMFGFFGNIGPIIAGTLLQYYFGADESGVMIDKVSSMQSLLSLSAVACVAILLLYYYMNKHVLTDPRYYVEFDKKPKKGKVKLGMLEGLKVIFSSRYLGYIAILVLAYGISINLVEGPWKAKVRALYPNTADYAYFMGTLNQLTGAASMIFMLIGAYALPKIKWLSGAILTPLAIFITGMGFFLFGVFFSGSTDNAMSFAIGLDPLWLAVMFGLFQNVFTKATKYSFFDPTKEMAYIPIDPELKTKGKAAVDVVGARVAKSGGALIQSALFIIFPLATMETITPYLMVIFFVVSVVWLIDVKVLSKEYEKSLDNSPSAS